jgi:xylulokinase
MPVVSWALDDEEVARAARNSRARPRIFIIIAALMAASVLLGVDLGTSSVKGVAFDPTGRALAAHAVPCAYASPRPGWAEAPPEAWWEAVRAILAELVRAVGARRVEAVGITGQAPTLLGLDADGRPVHPAILWLDVRSEAEVAEVAERVGTRAERASGNRLHPYYLGPKVLWLRRHHPARFARAATLLQSHSYPVLRLTGARVTDYSSASLCAPLYDAARRTWSREVLARLEVAVDLLPELRPAHEVAGSVTETAARETGLRAGTPVVVGGADFAASALAAGVTEPGEAALMLGTAGNLVLPFTRGEFDPRFINSHHVGCDRYLALGSTLCGAVLEWFRAVAAPETAPDALDREAAAVPVGADGVQLLPYLQGERTPVWDAGARGAFVGLSLAHRRGHLYRAVLEAVAVSFRHCAEIAREHGLAFGEVVAVNGGARSAVWRQILCDALGVDLLYAPEHPGAPAGAAILAGIGAGLLPGVEAAKRWRPQVRRHAPDARAGAVYAGLLSERKRLYPALARTA